MNARSLSVLEFEAVLARVAERTASPMGRDAILALRPETDPDLVRRGLAKVTEVMEWLGARPSWSPPGVPDARTALRALGAGGVLGPEELLVFLRLLQSSRELREVLPDGGVGATRLEGGDDGAGASRGVAPAARRLAERSPRRAAPASPNSRDAAQASPSSHLIVLRAALLALPEVESRLREIVDDEGQVRDGASPALAAFRRSLRSARARILERLEAFAASLPERIRVEGASVSIRDGRFVVAIRREGRGEVGGLVHGESATGATLFVEPPIAIELMNELRDLERDEREEVERILAEATGRLRPVQDDLAGAFDAEVEFDTLWARARTARAWAAHAPTILDAGEDRLTIAGGRHPLLLERGVRVVPFWITLGPDERVVVVSGPNTGGKTVFLKAVGLIHLLAQSGIVPPVEAGSELPVLDQVFADIGDGQSIAQSLSTFSAHLANAREIVESAGPRALVLMDEVGTGTDPSEGTALARAIIEALVERGCRALVTSHMGALKRLDAPGSGIVNASLLFDSERIEPTYTLQMGRPGRSYGLAIARRLGFPAEVLDRAETYVDSVELQVESLLERLETKERELASALAQAEAMSREAERMRADAEAREETLEAQERTAEKRAREQARQLLLEARQEVEEAIREVRASAGSRTEESPAEDVDARARRRVERAARAHQAGPRPRRGARTRGKVPVAEGDAVTVVGSGARGVVRELRDDRVTVEVGSVRLLLPREEVEPAEDAGGSAVPTGSSPRARVVGVRGGAPEVEVRTEADLRGLRVDEVDLAVGRALDGAIVGGLAEIRIIHGKGTGAVRGRVQEILKGDRRVTTFRPGVPGEGGAGVTIAVLERGS